MQKFKNFSFTTLLLMLVLFCLSTSFYLALITASAFCNFCFPIILVCVWILEDSGPRFTTWLTLISGPFSVREREPDWLNISYYAKPYVIGCWSINRLPVPGSMDHQLRPGRGGSLLPCAWLSMEDLPGYLPLGGAVGASHNQHVQSTGRKMLGVKVDA